MSAGQPEPKRRAAVAHTSLSVMSWGVTAVVLVVPLLVDVSHLEDFYSHPKVRALYLLAPVLALAWLLRIALIRTVDRTIVLPAVAFAGVSVAATWQAVDPAWSLTGAPWRREGLLTLLAYVAIFLASSTLRSPDLVRRWMIASLGGASLVACYGIAQRWGYDWMARDPDRVAWTVAFSTTGNPNFLGAYMVLILPVAMAAVATTRGRLGLVTSLGVLALLSLALLFTYSRAAWVALVLVILVTVLAVGWRRRELPVHRYLGAFALVLVLIGAFFSPWRLFPAPGGPAAAGSVPAAVLRAQSTLDVQDSSLRQRLYLWRVAAQAWLRRPLLGYGPEGFPLAVPQVPVSGEPLRPITVDKAHNETLDMAVSIGLLGVLAFWWLVGVSLGRAWRALTSSEGSRVWGLACLASIVGYGVDLQFSFSVVSVAPVFWSLLGVAAGLRPGAGPDPGSA